MKINVNDVFPSNADFIGYEEACNSYDSDKNTVVLFKEELNEIFVFQRKDFNEACEEYLDSCRSDCC